MGRTEVTDLVTICAALLGLALFAGLILVPAWTAYTRIWERLAAAFMSLYVLAAFVGVGALGALAAVYFWG